MDNEKCSICGQSRNEWKGEGISTGPYTFCSEQCEKLSKSGEKRSPERVIIEMEKADAYNANDMQPPLDEAPVSAGGVWPR